MEPYVYQAFPKWKYHRTEAAKVVNDPAEEMALGEGWYDSPAEIPAEPEPEPEPEQPVAPKSRRSRAADRPADPPVLADQP